MDDDKNQVFCRCGDFSYKQKLIIALENEFLKADASSGDLPARRLWTSSALALQLYAHARNVGGSKSTYSWRRKQVD